LVQLEFTQKIDFAPYYIPVRDKQIIARLEKRLQKLKA
jgi:hypothetical protein